MSEQPNGPAPATTQDDSGQETPHLLEHARTEGETMVDDAIGAADDPG
jgi:hypothetical protein